MKLSAVFLGLVLLISSTSSFPVKEEKNTVATTEQQSLEDFDDVEHHTRATHAQDLDDHQDGHDHGHDHDANLGKIVRRSTDHTLYKESMEDVSNEEDFVLEIRERRAVEEDEESTGTYVCYLFSSKTFLLIKCIFNLLVVPLQLCL